MSHSPSVLVETIQIELNYCCICRDEQKDPSHKCNRCNNTFLCVDCVSSGMELGILNKCPICRKNEPWCNIIHEDVTMESSPYTKYIIDRDYINNCKPHITKWFKLFLHNILFLILSYVIGTIFKLANNICLICGNVYINILSTLLAGLIIITIGTCLLLGVCIICMGCLSLGTASEN